MSYYGQPPTFSQEKPSSYPELILVGAARRGPRTRVVSMSSTLQIEAAAGSHVGHVRRKNDDSFAALLELGLFMVADGIGGRPGGEVASRMALEAVRESIEEDDPEETWPYASDGTREREELQLVQALRCANNTIFETAVRTPGLRGMGTTFTGALVRGDRAYLAHVGDSRIYRLRGARLEQLTDDHSVIEEARRRGVDLDEDASGRLSGVLLRSVGTERRVEVDTRVELVRPGDVLLLCSDGLWDPVPEDDIAATLAWQGRTEAIVAGLIGRALERGAPDNVTCVVVRFGRA